MLDGSVAFVDHDHDGDRDLIVTQRWTSPPSPDGDLCKAPRRVTSRDEVLNPLLGREQPACVSYAEHTVRLWNAETRVFDPPQPLPVDDQRGPSGVSRPRPPDAPDARAR